MSTTILHQYGLPLNQYHNNIDKHFDIKSSFQTTNTTLPTLIMKSDSESDTTTIIDDSDYEYNNNNVILDQKDYSFITETTSDITLSQDDTPETSVPNTPTSLSPSQSSKIATIATIATMESDNNRPLPDLRFSGTDKQVIHHVDVSENYMHTVKLHNFKNRFKQALGLSSRYRKIHQYRRDCIAVEQHHPSHSTKQNNSVLIEERKKDNENNIDHINNQCAERYRELMKLPAPTWDLKHYHPVSAVPTLSYSISRPGRYHFQQDKQLQNQHKELPTQPIISLTLPVPTPTKMPVKGILKKQSTFPPFPSPEEQDQQCNIETISSSSKLTSSSATTIENREQHYHSVEKNNKSTPNGTSKSRSWLHKLKSSINAYNKSSTQQQANNNNNNNGETEERKQRKRTIRYNKMVIVHETYTSQEYNREPDPNLSCTYLTTEEAQDIKNELNMFKFNEMIVHPNSRIYTHFFI